MPKKTALNDEGSVQNIYDEDCVIYLTLLVGCGILGFSKLN